MTYSTHYIGVKSTERSERRAKQGLMEPHIPVHKKISGNKGWSRGARIESKIFFRVPTRRYYGSHIVRQC